MSKKTNYFIVIILAVIALGLGYKIYEQQTPHPKPSSKPSAKSQPETTTNVLNFPEQNATPEEFKKHFELVSKMAVKTDVININNCSPEPLVLYATPETTFTIKNSDALEHIIHFGGKEYVIPAKGEKQYNVKNDFKDGLGVMGYGCDGKIENKNGVVGIISVYAN